MKQQPPHAGLKLVERPQEVEASLWRRLRFEDEQDCRRRLFDRYHALARIIAHHQFRRRPAYGLDRADFEQLAFGGLLEAIDRFDPLRGTPFDAYARHRIRGAIADGIARSSELAAQYGHRRQIERERMTSVAPGGASSSSDFIMELTDMVSLLAIGLIAEAGRGADATLPGAYDTVAWQEVQISVMQEMQRLPAIERSIIEQHYLKDVQFNHIARMLGVTKGRVSQLHRLALERMRAGLKVSE